MRLKHLPGAKRQRGAKPEPEQRSVFLLRGPHSPFEDTHALVIWLPCVLVEVFLI